jgi:hypothetical protein
MKLSEFQVTIITGIIVLVLVILLNIGAIAGGTWLVASTLRWMGILP